MTKWEAIKHYINSKEIGTIITRQGLLFDLKVFTIDAYKGILLRIGIIETCGVGKYKILYHVRSDLSATEAKKAADSRNWRTWFNDFKI